jgi:demethylmenaquinone methyltransferase/2-methoxy-6-polyprenyl-1,4-benzoquinol methylase
MKELTNEELRKIYNDIPKKYDKTNKYISFYQDVRWRGRLVKNIMRFSNSSKLILDVGSGKGELSYIAEKLMNEDHYVVMLDYAENMLNLSLIDSEKVLASFEEMPFRDKSFDIVMSSFSIHASNDIEKVIKEVSRVSKGVIGIIAMGKPDSEVLRIYLGLYLRYFMPCIVNIVRDKVEDYKYIYYIFRKNKRNSEIKEIFEKYIDVKVWEEKALKLFYFVIGFPKKSH